MDGVKLREVSGYDIVSDRRMYRWDVSMYGAQCMCYALDVKPGELEKARAWARKRLKGGTASLPLVKGAIYI